MQHLTHKEKIAIFGLYIGRTVIFNSKMHFIFDGINTMSFNPEMHELIGHNNDGSFFGRPILQCALVLNPLSELSDEHASEVQQLIKKAYPGKEDSEYPTALGIQEVCNNLDWLNACPFIIIDRLRELGYMVPWKGYDLFECGIALDLTKPIYGDIRQPLRDTKSDEHLS